ncbi:lytic transglycosylase domain-containing protein [Streptacidiphilus sp. NEAU-YB345]|uniref:Lytic transglycosylase domain-containing protein n=1 Tax=Streptacidiphilus fuscans TaxID=2789292 RepID=A0A931B631_9ACTN|nr:lytic transglycosylase domain-containing protein [Streptacidiphilus fuscans]
MAGGRSSRLWWIVLPVAALLLWGVTHGQKGATDASSTPSGSASGHGGGSGAGGASPSPSGTGGSWYTGSYDPSQFAAQVRQRAKEAGVDPQLVMAILYNEDYKPHDPAFERAWLKIKPTAALGIANMHEATYDQVKQGHSFADRPWTSLPDDPDLAIEAEAWCLHDLATDLPAQRTGSLTEDQLLALGYNTGPGNMLAFAHGVTVGPQAQQYLDTLNSNWAKAGKAIAI